MDKDIQLPPADPSSPETRLLRAILGACPECDTSDPHSHGGWINGHWTPLTEWANRPAGTIEREHDG